MRGTVTIDNQLALNIILAVAVLILAIALIRLEFRLKRLLRGKDAKSLEDSMVTLQAELKKLHEFQAGTEKYLISVENRLKKSLQGVSIVRFNAFKQNSGGNQSFASAFVNEKGDGVIISSLYSREVVGIYGKPVANSASKYELSEEEKQALTQALDTVRQ